MDFEKNILLESIKTGLINEHIDSDISFQPKIITNDYEKREKVLSSINFLLEELLGQLQNRYASHTMLIWVMKM